jgi:hypothetical protein
VSRVSAKQKGIEDKIKELKSLSIDKTEQESPVKESTPPPVYPVQENPSNENSGSFFDSIK